MGFYTTALCYRAGGDPPVVTGADLAVFCERLLALDILVKEMPWTVSLMYGRSIDQDDTPIYPVDDGSSGLMLIEDPNWDVEELQVTPEQALARLRQTPVSGQAPIWKQLTRLGKSGTNMYRASLDFGMLRGEFTRTIQHELEGNALFLGDVAFYIDVEEIRDPETRSRYEVGWMGLHIGGNGYPFPWTYEETLHRVCEHPQLQALREICRELWPASSKPVPRNVRKAREQMGRYWAEPLDAPHDWYWVIQGCV